MVRSLVTLTLGKFNSFHRYPHLEARLRQQTTREEAALALDAVMRREDFEPGARVKLFDALAMGYANPDGPLVHRRRGLHQADFSANQ